MRITTTVFTAAWLALGGATTASAQSTPVDLAGLTLAELIAVDVISDGDALPDDRRWHADYDYVRVEFDGYRDGTTDIPKAELLGPPRGGTFPVLPTRIIQQAHVFQLSYDLPSRTSVTVAVPYIRQGTYHVSVVPGYSEFDIMSHGIGDVSVTLSHRLLDDRRHSFAWTAGTSLPTGSIDQEGDTPRDTGQPVEQLPYTMQLGSGTYDVLLGVTYGGSLDPVANIGPVMYRAQVSGKVRTGKNARDYLLGNLYLVSLWASVKPVPWVEPTIEVRTQIWGEIAGADTSLQLGPGVFPAPVTNPAFFGGKKVSLLGGARFHLPEGLGGQVVEIVGGRPMYQSLNGPQPQATWRLELDWSVSF